jgi:hypothetical protein
MAVLQTKFKRVLYDQKIINRCEIMRNFWNRQRFFHTLVVVVLVGYFKNVSIFSTVAMVSTCVMMFVTAMMDSDY